MTPLFKKLNYKNNKEICIINSPEEFADELNSMQKFTKVITDYRKFEQIEFILTFVTSEVEINKIAPTINNKLKGDGVVWFAYPKKISKKYQVEINRDHGWELLTALGFETVRAVAIDEDWSTLRFRRIEFIKRMTRKKD